MRWMFILMLLSGCASVNKQPLTPEERSDIIRTWDLSEPNPWFWNE